MQWLKKTFAGERPSRTLRTQSDHRDNGYPCDLEQVLKAEGLRTSRTGSWSFSVTPRASILPPTDRCHLYTTFSWAACP